jgi:hypothetical protein
MFGLEDEIMVYRGYLKAEYIEPVAKVGYFCTGSCSFSG